METTTIEMKEAVIAKPSLVDLGRDRLWQALGIVSVVAIVLVYRRTFDWWWGEWWKDESYYSHGILIPILSALIVWANWKRIVSARLEPSAWGLAILLPAIFVQFVSHRSGIPSVSGLTLPIALVGGSLMLFGRRAAWETLFPTLFLYFMCVPPTTLLAKLSFQIQMLSTTAGAAGIRLIGLDATQTGTAIKLPSIDVLVGAPCSGFRILIALLSFTTFLVYMKKGPLWGRLSLIAFVFPISLILNSLRVFGIALVGEYWGEDMMHSFHDPAGWIMIVIAMILVFGLAKLVKCPDFKPEFEAAFETLAGYMRGPLGKK